MKIHHDISEAEQLIKDNIAVPFVRYDGRTCSVEIGYCVVNDKNEMKDKFLLADVSGYL